MIIRDIFLLILPKTYVVTPHLNRLNELVQMRGHKIWFRRELRKIIIKYSLLSRALTYVIKIININLQRDNVPCECV